jgi:hypothetical protein
MSLQTWQETLITAQIDGTALANTTTATSLLPAAAKATLPSNYFSAIGKTLRVKASGRVSTLVTTPGTLTLDMRFGATVVANGGAMNLNTAAQTNATWLFEMTATCRAIGTSANLMWTAQWASRAIIGSAVVASGGVTVTPLPDTAPAVGSNFDSTVTQQVDFFGKWSTGDPANSIQLHTYTLESLN